MFALVVAVVFSSGDVYCSEMLTTRVDQVDGAGLSSANYYKRKLVLTTLSSGLRCSGDPETWEQSIMDTIVI